ncbi:hypothetical protein RJT34_24711 [Clitoria ternatea]|uniref:Uncharacterized protein n=1 Tax=Clitoria ternatea TaxID=43366 RepID=A0AAN9IJF4_CLITE
MGCLRTLFPSGGLLHLRRLLPFHLRRSSLLHLPDQIQPHFRYQGDYMKMTNDFSTLPSEVGKDQVGLYPSEVGKDQAFLQYPLPSRALLMLDLLVTTHKSSLNIFKRNRELIKELSTPPPGSNDLSFLTKYSQSIFVQCKACF